MDNQKKGLSKTPFQNWYEKGLRFCFLALCVVVAEQTQLPSYLYYLADDNDHLLVTSL